jgi:hypothetical protein
VADEELSDCPGCGRLTTTNMGKCPNCWYVKNPSALPAHRRYKPRLWDDDDVPRALWGLVSWVPVAALLALGLLLDSTTLLVIAGVVGAFRLFGPLAFDYWMW